MWQPNETTATGFAGVRGRSGLTGEVTLSGVLTWQQRARDSGTAPPPAIHWPRFSKPTTNVPSLSQESPWGSPLENSQSTRLIWEPGKAFRGSPPGDSHGRRVELLLSRDTSAGGSRPEAWQEEASIPQSNSSSTPGRIAASCLRLIAMPGLGFLREPARARETPVDGTSVAEAAREVRRLPRLGECCLACGTQQNFGPRSSHASGFQLDFAELLVSPRKGSWSGWACAAGKS
mmetsp:Transcript_35531/g.100582  ORF Transcript_35531/g.100582 Transcript_35531/m.100582 type:complete len:233 (-) Transcript_35531:60-758(-)